MCRTENEQCFKKRDELNLSQSSSGCSALDSASLSAASEFDSSLLSEAVEPLSLNFKRIGLPNNSYAKSAFIVLCHHSIKGKESRLYQAIW